jgi:DoxX-like family
MMFIALVIASVLLALLCAISASGKLLKKEQIVEIISGVVGVPVRYFPLMGGFLLLAGAGVLIGLWLEALGVIAAAALVLYFLGAIAGHLRVRDMKNLAMPLPPLVLSIVVLVLRLATM